jgi:hypothetical protein
MKKWDDLNVNDLVEVRYEWERGEAEIKELRNELDVLRMTLSFLKKTPKEEPKP